TTPTPGTGGRQPAPWKALHDGGTAALTTVTTVGNLVRTGTTDGTGCAPFSWCGLQRAFGGKTR
ncbi:MAG TPA: hypothetical protein VKP11_03180, partial [Frankiaceae bacterium]|nr:hypothetical protein [Frankiaceae bacterium]